MKIKRGREWPMFNTKWTTGLKRDAVECRVPTVRFEMSFRDPDGHLISAPHHKFEPITKYHTAPAPLFILFLNFFPVSLSCP